MFGLHIAPWETGNRFNHEAKRTRKLLLHRAEITQLLSAVERDIEFVSHRRVASLDADRSVAVAERCNRSRMSAGTPAGAERPYQLSEMTLPKPPEVSNRSWIWATASPGVPMQQFPLPA